MIRALIFDFDGLILDTESSLIAAYGDVHAAHGVAFDRDHFLRSVGHADYAFDPWHAFEKRADRAALEIERREFNRARDLALPVLPGVVALLDAARTQSLRVALASNSTHKPFAYYVAGGALYLLLTAFSDRVFDFAERRATRGMRREAT